MPEQPAAHEPDRGAPVAELPPDPTPLQVKEAAYKMIRQLMAEYPESAQPLAIMGAACERFMDAEDAVTWWQKCLEKDPRRADVYVGLAAHASNAGDHEKAADLLRRARELNPRLPGVQTSYAATLVAWGKADEAIAVLQQEAASSRPAPGTLVCLGKAYLQRKEYEKAAESFRRAVELQPEVPWAYHGLGTAYARLGQRDKADECLAKFQTLLSKAEAAFNREKTGATDVASASLILADILVDAGLLHRDNGRLGKAEACWRRAAALSPQSRASRGELFELYMSMGRLQEALTLCEQLQALAPKNPVYHVRTGVALAHLRRYDEAEQSMRKALELDPNLADACYSLANLFLTSNRHLPEAKTLAQQLVALEPSAENCALLAEACRRNGDTAGARAALERALELEPGNERVKAVQRALREGR